MILSKGQISAILGTIVLFTLIYCGSEKTPQNNQVIGEESEETISQTRAEAEINKEIDDAILKVTSKNNPMEGIMELRGIADKYPDNVKAQMHLGLFSVQTKQYEKAIERFNNVMEADPENAEACYYLADIYETQGNKEKAIEQFNKYKNLIADTAVVNEVEKHITELKKS